MIRVIRTALVTLLLAGGAFALFLWIQWSDQIGDGPIVVDTRTDEQKAKVRASSGFNAEAAAKKRAARIKKTEQAKTDPIEYSIAEMLAEDKVKPLPFSTFKLLIDRSTRGKTTVRGWDIRKAASPLNRGRTPLQRIHDESSKHPQPTLSRNAITTLTGDPPNYPTNGQQLIDMLSEYRKLGIRDFRDGSFDGVSRDEINVIADFMESVVDLGFEVEVLQKWVAVREKVEQFSESYPSLRSDPLFNYFVGLIEYECGDYQAARKTLDTATNQFPTSHYPSRDVVGAHEILLRTLQTIKFDNSKVQTKILCDYCLAVNHWLCHDFRARPDQHLAAMYDLRSFFNLCSRYYVVTGSLLTSLSKQEFLPRSIQSAAHGLHYASLNRFYRTFRWLNEKQKGYVKANHQKGKLYFEDALKLDPANEVLILQMMEFVRHGDSPEQESEYFQRAIACRMDYCDAYWRRLFGLTPQRDGSIAKMIKFARDNSQNDDKDTISSQFVMPMCYFMIRNFVSKDMKERQEALDDPKFVGDAIRALDNIMAQTNKLITDDQVLFRDYMLTTKALLAASIDDMHSAHRTWRELDGSYNRRAANRFGVNSTFDVMRCESYALSTEFESEATELKELMGNSPADRLENATKIAELTEIVLDEISNEVAQLYFQQAQEQVSLEKAYDEGKEITLTFDPELLLWLSNDISQISQQSTNTGQLENQAGPLCAHMKSIAHTPGSKVVEFEVELQPRTPQKTLDSFAPSLLTMRYENSWLTIGAAKDVVPPGKQATVDGRETANSAFFIGNWNEQNLMRFVYLDLPGNTVKYRFMIAPKYMELYTDGIFRFRTRVWGEKAGEPNPFFELRHPSSLAGRGVASISDIRIKKWADGPPPLDQFDDAGLIKYYAKQVKEKPDAAWPKFWLAMAHHQSGSFEVALKHYQQAIELGVPETYAAFYVGDAHEQLGNQDQAVEWYRKAAIDDDPKLVMMRMMNQSLTTHPQNWASFRLGWHTVFSPDKATRESWDPAKVAPPYGPGYSSPAQSMFLAQIKAMKGDFKRAQTITAHVIENCNPELLPWIEEFASAYGNEKIYTEAPDGPKFYNLLDTPIEFFHHLELHN